MELPKTLHFTGTKIVFLIRLCPSSDKSKNYYIKNPILTRITTSSGVIVSVRGGGVGSCGKKEKQIYIYIYESCQNCGGKLGEKKNYCNVLIR